MAAHDLSPLRQIVSGGQTGVDRAALAAVFELFHPPEIQPVLQ